MRQFKDSLAPRARTINPVPHEEAGLTLIEMMIVLVIIAVVSGAIVMSGILNRPDEARATTARADIKTISGALAMYRLDNGDYPTAEQGLTALSERPTTAPVPPAWHSYVQEPPVDPWGRPYVYTVEGGSYTITSLGKDGKPGGQGVDADIIGKGQ
ncbi:MAG: type II secretion system major pseudopilin GspG [Sphingomonas sp.]